MSHSWPPCHLQPQSHQCHANTTTAVACGRINNPHRCCGVSTLTATTMRQRWQRRHCCLGHSNNCHRTVTAPRLWHGGLFFFWCVHSAPHCRLLASLPAPSWPLHHCNHSPTQELCQHPHCYCGHNNALDPCCHCSTSALTTTTTPMSTPLQQGSGHGSTITVTTTVASPSVLPCLWQHPHHHWGCSNTVTIAVSP